jgi:2',3'-cyclic-nucleotide 2'-phosphodiesterase (5'-nucleotidase family)
MTPFTVDRLARRAAILLVLSGLLPAGAGCRRADVAVVLTADTEGSVLACGSCSTPGGLGDMTRRATAISGIRRAAGAVLVADAGNAFIGSDSIESGGRMIVVAYEAIGYDAVNLSYRDFRLGKSATLGLAGTAHFPVISANLQDEASGRLIAAPFVVRRAGAVRVAFVGVTELPAGVAALDHIRDQLAGIRVRAPVEALTEWLPKARAESDRVVLLYYGSAEGLGAVGRRFGSQVAAILVGGLRPGDLPERATPPLAASAARGTEITRIDLPLGGPVRVTRFPIDDRYPPDPRVLDVLRTLAMQGTGPLR